MERQPEIVAAAEALRTWIHAQRAEWPRMAAAAAAPLPLLPMAPLPLAADGPAIAVEALAPPFLPSPALDETPTTRRQWNVQVPWSGLGRIGVRVAAVAAVLLVLAGAAVWGRGAFGRHQAAAQVGEVVIDSVPGPADVRVDNADAGKTPLTLQLKAGRHSVEFRRDGKSRVIDVDVTGGESNTARMDWNPRKVGTLQVDTTQPGAKVIVDGRERGVTPLTLDDIAVGQHEIVLENDEGRVRRRVQIGEGETEVLTEAIFSGWLHVAAPVDVTVSEKGRALQMDARGQVLLKAGEHDLLIESRAFGFSEKRHVSIEPGATTTVDIEAGTSTLGVTSSAPAEVQVDGVRAGSTPLAGYALKIGTHEVVVTDIFGNVRRQNVRVSSAPAQIEVDFSKP